MQTHSNIPISNSSKTPSMEGVLKDNSLRTNQSHLAFDTGTKKSKINLKQNLLDAYREKVYKARPNFREIIQASGDLPLYDYLRRHIRENRNKIIKKRKEELSTAVEEETRRLLGSEIADSVRKQLKGNNSVSTIQHSAPLSHPYVLSSTLQNALSSFGNSHPNLRNAIVLSCANISFNNYKFPRGHIFHSFGKDPKTHLLPLFGHTADARPVIHHPPYSHEAVKDIKNRIQAIKRSGDISDAEAEKLDIFFESIHNSPHPLSASNYHDQLTITNYHIFKELFKNYKKPIPNLVFLSQEMVALELIKKYHLQNDTTINLILFNPSMLELVHEHFNGLNGAFSAQNHYGTFLFWGLPQNGKYRVQLWLRGNALVSDDNSFKVELTPEAIYEAIEKDELIPNTLLTFMILAFYYGQYLSGGPSQTKNLTLMKIAYNNMLLEAGLTEDIKAIEDLNTTNLIISRPTFAFIDLKSQNERIPATGLDLVLYGDGGKSWDAIIEATKHTTLQEFFNRALVSFYHEFVSPANKTAEMSDITERDIEIFTGLDKKVPALITF